MKNKKGFTLIELLAVIVILAIIALIATPIVMNVIENSRKGAAERSAENYLRAVETAVAAERLDNNILNGEYDIQENGNLCLNGTTCTADTDVDIDMSGNKPSDGTVKIANGQVTLADTTMKIGDYTVSYDSAKKIFVAEKSGATLKTFTYYNGLDFVEYQFEYGMTWEQFINSSYNSNNEFRLPTSEELEADPSMPEDQIFDSYDAKVCDTYASALVEEIDYVNCP